MLQTSTLGVEAVLALSEATPYGIRAAVWMFGTVWDGVKLCDSNPSSPSGASRIPILTGELSSLKMYKMVLKLHERLSFLILICILTFQQST